MSFHFNLQTIREIVVARRVLKFGFCVVFVEGVVDAIDSLSKFKSE
jgi:hypothetical protein